ncbi:MAG TPA: PD-(D/E)XK nuclease family protein, partial [Polyangiaceae bacterium]
ARGVARFLSGAFAKSLSDPGLTIHRELSLVTPISPEPRSVVRPPQPQQLELFAPKSSRRASEDAPAPLTLLLKTTFDLLVVRSDGSVDIIDYKRSPGPTVGNRSGSDGRYRFQLAAYAMAARHHFRPWRLRAGLVYLLSEPTEPVFVDVVEPPPLRDLAASLQQARWANKWPAVPIDRCRRARCGFVESCHPHQARA